MSFLYPRTVQVSRPTSSLSVGLQPTYGGAVATNETVIATGLMASIQLKKQQGGSSAPALPANASGTQWRIFLPGAQLGLVDTWDVITDDLGKRYQVTGAYWNSLGCNLLCELLEA